MVTGVTTGILGGGSTSGKDARFRPGELRAAKCERSLSVEDDMGKLGVGGQSVAELVGTTFATTQAQIRALTSARPEAVVE